MIYIIFYVAAVLLLAGALAAGLGGATSGRVRIARITLGGISIFALLWIVVALALSVRYPAQAKYRPGSRPAIELLIEVSDVIVVLLPLWVSVAWNLLVSRLPDSGNRFGCGAVLALAAMPVALIVGIVFGCNIAGACL